MSRSALKVNLAVLLALAAALCATSAGVAAPTPTPSPVTGHFTPVVTPLGMSNPQMTVVVQLSADPVTVVDADSATPLTESQKQQLRSQLKSQQAPVAQQVASLGGQVLASYQSSYDGLKVRIRANQARSLSTLPGVIAVHPLQLMEPSNIHAIPLIGAPQVWDGLAGLHGEGIKIGDHRHRDRLHARRLRRAWDGRGLSDRARPGHGRSDPDHGLHDPGADSVRRADRAEDQGRCRPRRRRVQRRPEQLLVQPGAAARREPARLRRPRLARRRHRGRLRRDLRRRHLHRRLQREHRLGQLVERRPGRRAEGRPLRDQDLWLPGFDRRDDRRRSSGRSTTAWT